MAEDPFKPRTMRRKNVKGLALSAAPKPPAPTDEDSQALGKNDSNRADTLEIGVEFRFDLRSEDLVMIKELGAGNGGTVSKVRHTAWNVIMARKIIHVEAKKEVRKRIVRELQIMHECNSPYIVSFYGAFMNESGDVTMCMEYMDVGSLDSISKNFGPVRVDVLGKIAEAVLGGLKYLYLAHRIMHRDIKPSNVLVNSRGQIKLCDFGVSSELVNSVADTFVGTGTYMAPERIQGSPYTVKSDVWSVGLTLMELAIGKFPFSTGGENDDEDGAAGAPQGILDLLQQIVLEPAPKLPKSEAFPQILEDVIAKCLMKVPDERPTPQELYDTDPFLQAAKRTPVDLEQWAVSMMEKHNRKSHLVQPLSPGTRALLRGEETPRSLLSASSSTPGTSQRTPLSGDIPISASSNGSMASSLSTSASQPQQKPYSSAASAQPSYQSFTTQQPYPSQQRYQSPSQQHQQYYPPPSSSSSSAATTPQPQNPRPTENGSRPYPARTSSAQREQYTSPNPQASYAQGQINLPIRQAPPGGGGGVGGTMAGGGAGGRSSRPGTAGSRDADVYGQRRTMPANQGWSGSVR